MKPEDDQAQHLRTEFLRRVAHDIASPTGVAMTVLDELANADRPRPELLAMARRSLRRLMRLSEHLAIVAELELGDFVPEFAPVDLRGLLKRGIADAVAIDGRKEIVVTSSIPDAPLPAAADARLLSVVFREAVGNALKLASSRVEVSLKTEPNRAVVRIEDDGPGFAADSMASLGQRFVKRSSARGLGLSVSIAMQVVSAHGGAFAVETSSLPPGRRGVAGAAVVLTLPVRAPDT